MKFNKDAACNNECTENGCSRCKGTICSLGNDCDDCENEREFIENALSDNWDDNGEGDTCGFGVALALMKAGEKMRRRGWNGKNMFVFMAVDFGFHTLADLSCVSHLEGELTLPALVLKTADDKFCVGWLASQTDMLAEDWEIYGGIENE